MGQEEIAEILKEHHPVFLSGQEIMLISKSSKAAVSRCLKKLSKRNEIQYTIKHETKKVDAWRGSYWKKYYGIKEE
jgi:predicted transcriptional regulator